MYSIALCDDETAELDKTEVMLNAYREKHSGYDFVIERFESAGELLHMVGEKNYVPDLLLMDIYMPEKLGTTAARELRSMGSEGRIVFMTTSTDHALEAFGVDASQYLIKPVSKEKMFSVLDRVLERMDEERKKYLLLRIDGRFKRVALNDIVYCEAQGNCQCLNLSDGTQAVLRMTMTKIYEMLSPYPEFVKVGVAYIVNLTHVDSLNAQEMYTDIGKSIHLPRGSYASLREQYFHYYCEEEVL